MSKLLSNPLVIGAIGAIVTALVMVVYSMFTAGSKTVMVPQDPSDPDSPQIETRVPVDGISTAFMFGASLFVGILCAAMASMALSGSGNDFDLEEILDEQF